MEKEELVNAIVKLEWNAFDKVDNLGGRADCCLLYTSPSPRD